MKWLADCSAAALAEALRAAVPELAGYPVTISPTAGASAQSDPAWHSSTAVIGGRFVVKFAWSRPAALRVAHEIAILAALARAPAGV